MWYRIMVNTVCYRLDLHVPQCSYVKGLVPSLLYYEEHMGLQELGPLGRHALKGSSGIPSPFLSLFVSWLP
jgi:hypothetical protein